MNNKKSLAILAVVLLLCVVVAAWWFLKSRRPKAPNMPPIAALRLDSLDETNRVVTLSDGGSRDPDGTVQSWRIAWGDGKEENLAAIPRKAAHTYAAEGDYTISLWCVDNLGATSSPPALTNITFDFLKRQKAREQAEAEAKREAERLKEEAARKEAERLEQERKKQEELAAEAARKAREQQALEAKRKAEEELARQKALEAAKPPPTPLAAALDENPSPFAVIFTPSGCTLGEFQISKEKTDGTATDGNLLVILVTRCVNFPNTRIPTSDWKIDGKDVQIQASRIRASLSQGRHEVTAILTPKGIPQPVEIKADVMVRKTGECVVIPKK
jgi:chemotaxis protein histidine kinase CheA